MVHFVVSSNDSRLISIATSKILRCDNGDTHGVGVALDEDELGMIIDKKDLVNCLNDKRPQAQRLVCSFIIKQQLNILNLTRTTNMVEAYV